MESESALLLYMKCLRFVFLLLYAVKRCFIFLLKLKKNVFFKWGAVLDRWNGDGYLDNGLICISFILALYSSKIDMVKLRAFAIQRNTG